MRFTIALIQLAFFAFAANAQETVHAFGRVTNQFHVGRDSLQITFTYTWDDQDTSFSETTSADGSYEIDLPEPPDIIGDEDQTPYPSSFDILQNYPNPFNPSTVIPFSVSKQSRVSLTVFSLDGRIVSRLISSKSYNPGSYFYVWKGINDFGNSVPAGLYFCQFQADDFENTIKMILLDGAPSHSGRTSLNPAKLARKDFNSSDIISKYSTQSNIDEVDDINATVSIRDIRRYPYNDEKSNFRTREMAITGQDSVNLQVTDHLINSDRLVNNSIEFDYTLEDNEIEEGSGNWNSWTIEGTLHIRRGGSLTIPPTRRPDNFLNMHHSAKIEVQDGTLNINGGSWDTRILLRPRDEEPPDDRWGGIEFGDESESDGPLQFMEIRNSSVGIEFDGCNNDFTVRNCYIWNSNHDPYRGIEIDTEDGRVTVTHCKITENFFQDEDRTVGYGINIGDGNPIVTYCNFFDQNPVTGDQNYVHIRVNGSATINYNNFADSNDNYHAYRHDVWCGAGRDDQVDVRHNWWGEPNIDPTEKIIRDDWTSLSDDPGVCNWNPVSNEFINDAGIEE